MKHRQRCAAYARFVRSADNSCASRKTAAAIPRTDRLGAEQAVSRKAHALSRLFAHRGITIKKSLRAPQRESQPTWRGRAGGGSASKGCVTLLALYFSMKPPSQPTWSVPTVGARVENFIAD